MRRSFPLQTPSHHLSIAMCLLVLILGTFSITMIVWPQNENGVVALPWCWIRVSLNLEGGGGHTMKGFLAMQIHVISGPLVFSSAVLADVFLPCVKHAKTLSLLKEPHLNISCKNHR